MLKVYRCLECKFEDDYLVHPKREDKEWTYPKEVCPKCGKEMKPVFSRPSLHNLPTRGNT